MYEKERKDLYDAHMILEKYGLVAYTSGNVSVRIGEHVLIKPSGVPYTVLKPEDFVVVDLEGNVVEGEKNHPSTRPPIFICTDTWTGQGL